jgi:hypothetical protein
MRATRRRVFLALSVRLVGCWAPSPHPQRSSTRLPAAGYLAWEQGLLKRIPFALSVFLRPDRTALAAVVFASASALSPATAVAQKDSALPRLYTNEDYVSDVTARSTLDIEDVMSVFEYVLSQLPSRVRVFPTENYYYFHFYHEGVRFAGNLRFDVEARDAGFVEFIYFRATTELFFDDRDHHETLGNDDGVIVERIADLTYAVSCSGKRVVFELNDLSDVAPPKQALSENETFLGPVADESGMRFFLTFDESLKIFHYVLDETVPVADELLEVRGLDHTSIGRRTGFAFFDDPNMDRRLLVGVYAGNIDLNNYFDGPFDQLPDNFLNGDELRRAILLAFPDADPRMDRLGIAPGGETRRKIAPYFEYGAVKDLLPVDGCAGETGTAVYTCLESAFDSEP